MNLSGRLSVAAAMLGTGLVIVAAQTAALGGGRDGASPPALPAAPTETQTPSAPPSTSPPPSTVSWSTALGSGSAAGVTPGVVGGLVVLGGIDGTLYALHRDRGDVAWAVQVSELGTPAGPAVAGETLLVTVPNALLGLEASTGSTRWASPIAGVGSAPTVAGDVVYVASGRLQAFDVDTGEQRWTADIGVGTLSSAAAVDDAAGLVVTGAADGTVYAVDAASGELRWTQRTEGRLDAPVLITDGLVLTAGADGVLTGLDLDTGQLRWTRSLSTAAGGFHTTIAAAEGVAYAQASSGVLYAVDTATGTPRWEVVTNGGYSAPLLTRDTLYLAGADDAGQGELQTIDARTGDIRNRLGIDEHVKANLTLADTTIYVPTINQLLSVTTS